MDLRSKITQITVHERNGVLDELSENSKKCAILRRVCKWVIELFPEWLVLNSVLFMHRDLCDLGSQILIRIFPKERTLSHADQ